MEREQATKFIYDLLRALMAKKGSDLFITAGFPPAMKIDNKMTPVSQTALTGQHTQMLVRAVMNDKQAAEFEAKKECNFAIAPASIGRFRVNCFVQMGQVGMVLRVITTEIPNFEDLKLPPINLPDPRRTGFEIADFSVHFEGYCAECRRKKNKPASPRVGLRKGK